MADMRSTSGVVLGYTPTAYETTAVLSSKKVNEDRAEATRIAYENLRKTKTQKQSSNIALGYSKSDYQTTAKARDSPDLWGEACIQKQGQDNHNTRGTSIRLGTDGATYVSTAKSANLNLTKENMAKARQESAEANNKFKTALKHSSISFDNHCPATDYTSSTKTMFVEGSQRLAPTEITTTSREKPMTSADFRKSNFTLGTDSNDFATESRLYMKDPGSAARAEHRLISTKGSHQPMFGLSNVPIGH